MPATRVAGLRRLAGPDDGHMYAPSSADYQATLLRMTTEQRALNDAATAALYQKGHDEFVAGTEAKDNTLEQTECCKELACLARQGTVTVVALEKWSRDDMGRAGMHWNDKHGGGVYFNGECVEIDGQTKKVRIAGGDSACIAHHWLKLHFSDRLKQGDYIASKPNALEALEDELRKAHAQANFIPQGRYLVFVDARFHRFTDHDWAEAAKVARGCGALLAVSVDARDDAPKGTPFVKSVDHNRRLRLKWEAKRTAKETKAKAAAEAAAEAAETAAAKVAALLAEGSILRELSTPESSWKNLDVLEERQERKERALDRMPALVKELAVLLARAPPSQLPKERRMLKTASAMLEQRGDYVSGSDEEDDDDDDHLSEPEWFGKFKLPRYHISGPLEGHHESCCSERCRCSGSTGIGANGGKSRRLR